MITFGVDVELHKLQNTVVFYLFLFLFIIFSEIYVKLDKYVLFSLLLSGTY